MLVFQDLATRFGSSSALKAGEGVALMHLGKYADAEKCLLDAVNVGNHH